MADSARRRDWWKPALVAVVAIEVLGGLSGWLSNSGYGNPWFDALRKPAFMPPGWIFGVVWPILYALMGVGLAMILVEPASPARRNALALFFIQLVLNFAWSPLFFAFHAIHAAKLLIFAIAAVAAAAGMSFTRIKPVAGLLLVPYILWLVFAGTLNATIEKLNPGAGSSLLGF